MLECPKFSRAPKASLDLIKNQQRVLLLAPLREFVNVLDRREVRSHALIRFEDDPGDVFRTQPLLFDGSQKQFKARVLRPKAIGKWHLYDRWILIHDPRFLTRNPARLLGAKSTSVKAALG